MKIQFASDLHLEEAPNCDFLKAHPIKVEGDILVLAGDTFVLGKQSAFFNGFIDWCSENFTQTFVLLGNHEFFGGHDIATTLGGWEMQLRHNVRFVNNMSFRLGDVELFFTTLWSRVSPHDEEAVNRHMRECVTGTYSRCPFRACDYAAVHELCLSWLDNSLKVSNAPAKVVVTHHSPVMVEDPKYANNRLSSAFLNPMEDYVEQSGVDAWIFGHTHYGGADGMRLGNTVLRTNQLGYAAKGVLPTYTPCATITIPQNISNNPNITI